MSAYYLSMAFVFVLVVVVHLLLPAFVRRTLPFGVRIPEEYADDPAVIREQRSYRLLALLASLAVAVFAIALVWLTGQTLVLPGGLIVLLFLLWAIYYRSHRRLRRLKARQGWFERQSQGVVVETSLRTEPTPVPWLWAVPAVAILLVTIAIGIWKYPSLPPTLTIHWGANGQPNGFATTSAWSAFSVVFTQVFITVLFVGLAGYIPHFRQELDAEHPEASARQHRAYQREMIKGLLFLAACANVSMLLSSLMIWTILPASNGNLAIGVTIPLMIGTLGLAAIALRAGQGGSRLRAWSGERDHTAAGVVNRDDDSHWVAGVFYVNRDDPALIVNKRFGIGWTLNFGHPAAWVIFILITSVAVLVPLLQSVSK